MSILRLSKDIVDVVKESNKTKTSPYDTQGEVVRLEGDTAWVHLAGGIDETPVRKTISCSVGDSVQVRVGGGKAWIVGNASAPPTDDKAAIVANNRATEAHQAADNAEQVAEGAEITAQEAKKEAKATSQHFWHDSDGAHVTQKTQEEYQQDPANGGANALIDSNGFFVRSGTTAITQMTKDGFKFEYGNGAYGIMDVGTVRIHESSIWLAYPYYTFGTRLTNSLKGQGSYALGESVTSSGQRSVAMGYATIADGYNQVVIGQFNEADSTKIFIIGGGGQQRRNILTVDRDGIVDAGGYQVGGEDIIYVTSRTTDNGWHITRYSDGFFEAIYSGTQSGTLTQWAGSSPLYYMDISKPTLPFTASEIVDEDAYVQIGGLSTWYAFTATAIRAITAHTNTTTSRTCNYRFTVKGYA